jgi:hypothetical protein
LLLLLLLPFKAMLLSESARGRKSGNPPLFAPSFKVQRNTAHNRNSGFAVLSQCDDLNAHRVRKVPAGNQKRAARAPGPIGRHTTGGFLLGNLISRHRRTRIANQPIRLFQNVGICRLFSSEEAEHHEGCAE